MFNAWEEGCGEVESLVDASWVKSESASDSSATLSDPRGLETQKWRGGHTVHRCFTVCLRRQEGRCRAGVAANLLKGMDERVV